MYQECNSHLKDLKDQKLRRLERAIDNLSEALCDKVKTIKTTKFPVELPR